MARARTVRDTRVVVRIEIPRYEAIRKHAEKVTEQSRISTGVSSLVYRWIDDGMKRDGVKW